MSTSTWWPLHDLRLRTGDLDLTAMTEADLAPLCDVLPDDLGLNPAATRFEALSGSGVRAAVVHQEYWRSMGTWSPDDWEIYFVVRRGGELLGLQGLEGPGFRRLRTVDTSSWLVSGARGTGIGTAMRRAVLALAFDHLGAQAAVSSAWHDNDASLGVSRRLGYRPNGELFHPRDGGVDTLAHLRMTLADWRESGGGAGVGVGGGAGVGAGPAADVIVEGLTPALPLFDLPAT